MVSVKKSIRDTQRLLKRPDLPADVRQEQERKLAALQGKNEETHHKQKESKLAEKYRMLKFIEKKKVVRKLTTIWRNETTNSNAESNEAEARLIEQLNYITYYPKDKKYISLFPKSSLESQQAASSDLQRSIMQEISGKVLEGTLVDSSVMLKQNLARQEPAE